MGFDWRVHVRVGGVLIMHPRGFVKLGERICCWGLQRVGELRWIWSIVKLGSRGIMIRCGGGFHGTGGLLLGFRLDCRVGRLEKIMFDGGRGDDNR
jgi:hypothetical protein